jgi:predicted HAD superfamily Cof-like phosphohydrolase
MIDTNLNEVSFEYYNEDNPITDSNTYLGKTPMQMLTQFHKTMGHPIAETYTQNSEADRLRIKLLSEEFDEVCAAETPENLLKELADVLYVTYGYALTFGFDLDEAFRRVHASNMSKVDANGFPIVRSDGKIMKGENYREPDLSDLVN